MPRYHALDTAIKLCVWDPHVNLAQENEGYDTFAGPETSPFFERSGSFGPRKRETYGPALGYVVDDLKEGCFEGYEGVDFLAPGMPFYLVKAGSGLFESREDVSPKQSSLGEKDKAAVGTPAKIPANATENSCSSQQSSALSSVDTKIFALKVEPVSNYALKQRKPHERPGKLINYDRQL